MIEFFWFVLGGIMGGVLTYAVIVAAEMRAAAAEAEERDRRFQEAMDEYKRLNDDNYG